MILIERIAAACPDRLAAGLDHGTIGRGERQLRNDDVRQRLALDVDALPEAVHAQQHRRLLLPKLLEQARRRQALALTEEREALVLAPGPQLRRRPLHGLIAREQDECSALRIGHVLANSRQRRFLEFATRGRGIGHGAKQVQLDLPAVIERTAELQRGMIRKAETLLDVVEANSAAGAQRGAGKNRGRHAIKDLLTQKTELLAAVAGPLDPVDLVGQLLPMPRLHTFGKALAAEGRRLKLDFLFGVLDRLADAIEVGCQLQKLSREPVGDDLRRADALRVAGVRHTARLAHLLPAPGEDRVEELVGRIPGSVDLLQNLAVAVGRQQAVQAVLAFVGQPVEQVVRLAARDRQPEVVGRHVLDIVRLVEDDDAVLRQNASAASGR